MKLNKLFTFTLAALAMAACSNDDEPGIDKGGQKGELIDAISIAFTSSSAPATRADKGEHWKPGGRVLNRRLLEYHNHRL